MYCWKETGHNSTNLEVFVAGVDDKLRGAVSPAPTSAEIRSGAGLQDQVRRPHPKSSPQEGSGDLSCIRMVIQLLKLRVERANGGC